MGWPSCNSQNDSPCCPQEAYLEMLVRPCSRVWLEAYRATSHFLNSLFSVSGGLPCGKGGATCLQYRFSLKSNPVSLKCTDAILFLYRSYTWSLPFCKTQTNPCCNTD